MKKQFRLLLTILLMAFALVPSVKSLAAVAPAAPSGLGLTGQQKDRFMLSWNYDSNIAIATDNQNFGYEVVINTINNKKIKTVDLNILQNYSNNVTYDISNLTPNVLIVDQDYTKMYMNVSSSKMKKQAFKFKVRAYTYDSVGNKIYGEYSSERIIVPRACVTKFKALSRTSGKISWNKIKGAKSYTIYISNNDGTSFKKKGTTKGTSFTVKGMTLYKKYPIYVVANGIKVKKKKYNSTKPEAKSSNASRISIYLR